MQKITATPAKNTQKDNLSSFFATTGVQDLVTRLALDSKDQKKNAGIRKLAKRDAMLDMLKLAMNERIGGHGCTKCGCKDFIPNAFNREKCNICFHNHNS